MNAAPSETKTPAIVLADATGAVVYKNRTAADLTGKETGAMCWETIGRLEGAEGLPCEHGCVQRLLASGAGHATSADVGLPDGRYHLVCMNVAGQAVCVLARLGAPREPWQRLTPREREVLRLLSLGETTGGIARELDVSEATVRTHVEHMRRRFGVSTRAGLVGCCHELGLI